MVGLEGPSALRAPECRRQLNGATQVPAARRSNPAETALPKILGRGAPNEAEPIAVLRSPIGPMPRAIPVQQRHPTDTSLGFAGGSR